MTDLTPPSRYHVNKARENAEFLMTLDDVQQWIDFLSSGDFLLLWFLLLAAWVARAWIKERK